MTAMFISQMRDQLEGGEEKPPKLSECPDMTVPPPLHLPLSQDSAKDNNRRDQSVHPWYDWNEHHATRSPGKRSGRVQKGTWSDRNAAAAVGVSRGGGGGGGRRSRERRVEGLRVGDSVLPEMPMQDILKRLQMLEEHRVLGVGKVCMESVFLRPRGEGRMRIGERNEEGISGRRSKRDIGRLGVEGEREGLRGSNKCQKKCEGCWVMLGWRECL